MSYGKLIKKIRKERNMSLRAFGKLVDVDYSHLARLEKEESTKGKERLSPSIDTLQQICTACDYPFHQFLEEAGYIKPIQNKSPIDAEDLTNQLSQYMLENKSNFTKEQVESLFAFLRSVFEKNDTPR